MVWVDAVIALVVVLAAVVGWRAGLVPGLALLAGTALGVTLALNYGALVGGFFLPHSGHAWVLGYAIILALACLSAALVGATLQDSRREVWLGWPDRLGGLAVGVTLAGVLLTVTVIATESFGGQPAWAKDALHASRLAPAMVERGEFLRPSAAEEQPKA